MELSELSVTKVGTIAKSKAVIYRFMTLERKVYLHQAKDTNFKFLRDSITWSEKVYWNVYFYVLVHKR